MTDIQFISDMTVKLVRAMAADEFVVQAAQVSAKGETDIAELVDKYEAGKINIDRFISALMKGRHGSPFEHTVFTFFVEAPIFVFREWQRHRISSFNEMSGRYTTLKPKFYIPDGSRSVINSGTKMKPDFSGLDWDIEGNREDVTRKNEVRATLEYESRSAWGSYQHLLSKGIANEVARMVLPVNIYSQMYWTVNARSLMNFLSLRVGTDDSTFRSYPQYEIDLAAQKVEKCFFLMMPATHKAFVENGRVAP